MVITDQDHAGSGPAGLGDEPVQIDGATMPASLIDHDVVGAEVGDVMELEVGKGWR